jgi:DNA (cytosine-5)-methyltransferase 1
VRVGSLFSGYGGLDLAVLASFGGRLGWQAEVEPGASRVLAAHWPDVPNHGDVTRIDWDRLPPVDILTAGTPCQDISHAGQRRGLNRSTRSGLWSVLIEALDVLRPRLLVWENVPGVLNAQADSDLESCPGCLGSAGQTPTKLRAFGRVLGDLADLGYDARWIGVHASDVGAPHRRHRIFLAAYPWGDAGAQGWQPTPRQTSGLQAHGDAGRRGGAAAADTTGGAGDAPGSAPAFDRSVPVGGRGGDAPDWGNYRSAVHTWEVVLGRTAPNPTEPTGRYGRNRLSPRFVEWLMGLPDGHVTDPRLGLTHAEQLTCLGNGVVPQQAARALTLMWTRRLTE